MALMKVGMDVDESIITPPNPHINNFMINKHGVATPFTVDIGRPSILSNQAVKRWKQIHDWVKTSPTPVSVSQAFYVLDKFIQRDEYYQGSGYHYTFGFKNVQDRDAFVQAVNQAKEDFPQLS